MDWNTAIWSLIIGFAIGRGYLIIKKFIKFTNEEMKNEANNNQQGSSQS
jgi:uncharacterized membrane-anchored protein YhcB (DUF1043 family)